MNHWPFIVAAYAVTMIGVAALVLWSLAAMRRAEREASRIDK